MIFILSSFTIILYESFSLKEVGSTLKLIAPFLNESEDSIFNLYPKISLRNSVKKLASLDNSGCVVGYVIQVFFESINGLSPAFSVMLFGSGITW